MDRRTLLVKISGKKERLILEPGNGNSIMKYGNGGRCVGRSHISVTCGISGDRYGDVLVGFDSGDKTIYAWDDTTKIELTIRRNDVLFEFINCKDTSGIPLLKCINIE